jgi:hypothetical protein
MTSMHGMQQRWLPALSKGMACAIITCAGDDEDDDDAADVAEEELVAVADNLLP